LILFCGLLVLVVWGSLYLDRILGLPKLLPMPIGSVIGVTFFAIGLVIWAWCVLWFLRAKGTPVPFNPPQELVTTGPYAWSRNPMLTGVFAFLVGLGFLLRSVSLVFICTPIFVVLNVLELKFVEEPELELRFGKSYTEYKEQVGMFSPRSLWHRKEETK
jgi:protein-S-isoprenylcysteine O-methyltransferase Ste14